MDSTPFIYESFLLYATIGRLVRPGIDSPSGLPPPLRRGRAVFLVTNFTSWSFGVGPGCRLPEDPVGAVDCYGMAIPFSKGTFIGDLFFTPLFFAAHAAVLSVPARRAGGRMKYAALIEYIADKEKIGSIRPAHRAYLTKLLGEGKTGDRQPLLTDDYGAMIVYEASSPRGADAAPGRPVPRRGRLGRLDDPAVEHGDGEPGVAAGVRIAMRPSRRRAAETSGR